MGLIIKKRRDYLIKFPIWLTLIVFFGLSPFLIGVGIGHIQELITNKPCHEGNCFWGVLPWLCFITIPIAAIGLLAFLIVVIIDSLKLKNK